MDIGQYLMKARKQKGLSQEDVANTLNVSRQSVSLWECDQTIPSLDNLIALSKLYDTSIDILTGQKEFVSLNNSNTTSEDDKARELAYQREVRLSYLRFLIVASILSCVSLLVFWVPGVATIFSSLIILFSILSMRRIKTNKNLLTLIIGITYFIVNIFCYINLLTIFNIFEEVFL